MAIKGKIVSIFCLPKYKHFVKGFTKGFDLINAYNLLNNCLSFVSLTHESSTSVDHIFWSFQHKFERQNMR